MKPTATNQWLYWGLHYGGIFLMLLAFGLSFFLNLPSQLRFGVTALIGIVGYGLSSSARAFKP